VVVGLLGFLLAIGWRAEGRAQAERTERRAELAVVVELRQDSIARLEQRLADLRARLDEVAVTSGERELQRLRDRVAELASLSGVSPVEGPGLVVELSDAPGTHRTDPNDADLLIQDADLQAVVNALWRAGAEAVAVDGQRIVSTSSIRNAGAVVRMNYRVLASPYRVEAVGDPGRLADRFASSPIARSFGEWTQTYHLGFSFQTTEQLTLPGFQGSLRFSYAQPTNEKG